MNKLISVFLIFVLMATFSSCAERAAENEPDNTVEIVEEPAPVPSEGGVLKLSMHGVDTLNPLVTKSAANSEILSLCFDSLFVLRDDLYPENSLCESYFLSPDGLELTVNIKNGVNFHDGSPLTAADVAFSANLAKESGGVYSENLKNLAGVRISGNSAIFTLSSPEFNFISNLTFPVIKEKMSVSDAISRSTEYEINGTGLYGLAEYEFNKTLTFKACEEHFSGKSPYIKDIRIDIVKNRETAVSMFENSITDVLLPQVLDDSGASGKKNCREVSSSYGSFVFLGVNNQHPVLLDSNVKRVISDAINRDALVSLNEERFKKAVIPVYPSSWLCPAATEDDYLPQEAKEALSSLGWQDTDSDGFLDKTIIDEKTDLYLDILVNDSRDKIRLAELIKKNLEDIGIATTLTVLPFWEYTERISGGSFDLFVGEVRFPDNQNISDFVQNSGNLFGAYFEELHNSFEKLSLTGEKNDITSEYSVLCASLSEHLPLIGLYFSDDAVLVNNRIKGNITPVRGNSFANIYDWFIY